MATILSKKIILKDSDKWLPTFLYLFLSANLKIILRDLDEWLATFLYLLLSSISLVWIPTFIQTQSNVDPYPAKTMIK